MPIGWLDKTTPSVGPRVATRLDNDKQSYLKNLNGTAGPSDWSQPSSQMVV